MQVPLSDRDTLSATVVYPAQGHAFRSHTPARAYGQTYNHSMIMMFRAQGWQVKGAASRRPESAVPVRLRDRRQWSRRGLSMIRPVGWCHGSLAEEG